MSKEHAKSVAKSLLDRIDCVKPSWDKSLYEEYSKGGQDFFTYLKAFASTPLEVKGPLIPLSDIEIRDIVSCSSLATGGVEMNALVKVSKTDFRFDQVTGEKYKIILAWGDWYDSRTGKCIEEKSGTAWINPSVQYVLPNNKRIYLQ